MLQIASGVNYKCCKLLLKYMLVMIKIIEIFPGPRDYIFTLTTFISEPHVGSTEESSVKAEVEPLEEVGERPTKRNNKG